MGQVSAKFRRATNEYIHWCPGCKETHLIPDTWVFDGNLEIPTFSPSVRITSKQIVKNERGEWTGDWVRDEQGKVLDECCHYIMTTGHIQFCSDSTHHLSGQTVPLPDLPERLCDIAPRRAEG